MLPNYAVSRPSLRNSSSYNQSAQSSSRLRQSQSAASDSHPASSLDDSPASAAQQGSEESTASTLVKATKASARERVVSSYHRLCGDSGCSERGNGECEHGVLSPRASSSHVDWEDSTERGSGSYGGRFDSRGGDLMHGVFGDAVTDGLIGKSRGRRGGDDEQGIKNMSTTEWLARRHHVKGRRRM